MIFSYEECIARYKSDYQIKKAVDRAELYKIEKGIYADVPNLSHTEILAKKYPYAVLTMNSAFYHYGLTDTIPDQYYMATPKDTTKIRDERVRQYFLPEKIFGLGIREEVHHDVVVRMYNRERMLIEVVRNKSKLPYDYYKEIILRYRKILDELDIQEIQEYVADFPKSNSIIQTLQNEVF